MGDSDAVLVAVRVRPFNQREKAAGAQQVAAACEEDGLRVKMAALRAQLHQVQLPVLGRSLDLVATQQSLAELRALRARALSALESEHAHIVQDVGDEVLLGVTSVQKLLGTLAHAQRTLEKLGVVLASPQKLAPESGLLEAAQTSLSDILQQVVADAPDLRAGSLLADQQRLEILSYELDNAAEQLARAQNMLQQRLSTARDTFAPLQLIEEAALLDLVATASADDIASVRRFLPLVLPNVHELTPGDKEGEIVGVVCVDTDLPFNEPLVVSGMFYEWVHLLDDRVRRSHTDLAAALRQQNAATQKALLALRRDIREEQAETGVQLAELTEQANRAEGEQVRWQQKAARGKQTAMKMRACEAAARWHAINAKNHYEHPENRRAPDQQLREFRQELEQQGENGAQVAQLFFNGRVEAAGVPNAQGQGWLQMLAQRTWAFGGRFAH